MKYNRLIGTTVLFVLLGTTLPALAQHGDEGKHEGGNSPQRQHETQPQHAEHAQQAQPQHSEQAHHDAQQHQPQRAQETHQSTVRQPSEAHNRGESANHDNHGNNDHGNHGRISDASYNSHFGHDHHFRMGHPQMVGGYNRFQYGGYSFGYNEGWPVGWNYDDDCYVVFEDGAYYMYNVRHPGVHISLNIF